MSRATPAVQAGAAPVEGAAPALELLVHGVGGTTPQAMLDDPRTVRVTGDDTAAIYRRAEDVDAEAHPERHRGRPLPEAYVWCNLTSGNSARALWLLLLPFMVVNLAHWMRPPPRVRSGRSGCTGRWCGSSRSASPCCSWPPPAKWPSI